LESIFVKTGTLAEYIEIAMMVKLLKIKQKLKNESTLKQTNAVGATFWQSSRWYGHYGRARHANQH
jgi:hypothetical protein